jgi:hypothetical protein
VSAAALIQADDAAFDSAFGITKGPENELCVVSGLPWHSNSSEYRCSVISRTNQLEKAFSRGALTKAIK